MRPDIGVSSPSVHITEAPSAIFSIEVVSEEGEMTDEGDEGAEGSPIMLTSPESSIAEDVDE